MNEIESAAKTGLRFQCLSFTEVIGQSIANIAPSATPAFTIPAVFALAANGTWLSYLFATVAVLLVGVHINYFAKRSASPGALYTFITDGAGPATGFISGNGLVLAYLLTASAVLPPFANFMNVVFGYLGFQIPPVVICLVGALFGWFVVYKDVQISAKVMLTCEAVSLLMIIVLGIIVFAKSNFRFYGNMVTLRGVSFDNIRLGLVLAFFSFVGFESATSLGKEARNPLHNIPKAVLISGAVVGTIFVAFSFVEIGGYLTVKGNLSQATAPLNFLAVKNGVAPLGLLISIGAMISFWSCFVACTTAAARIMHSMSHEKMMPEAFGKVHAKNQTPYISSTVLVVVEFAVPAVMLIAKLDPMAIFSYCGTIATLGFLVSYLLVVIAAPIYLKKSGQLQVKHIVLAAVTFLVLMIPLIGSVYPIQPFPFFLFPIIFAVWLGASAIWYFAVKARNNAAETVEEETEMAG